MDVLGSEERGKLRPSMAAPRVRFATLRMNGAGIVLAERISR
jgi:hypothetical protein